MTSHELIVEYRVRGIDYEAGRVFEEVEYEGRDVGEARRSYQFLKRQKPPFDRVWFERRTITASAWRSLPAKDRS